MTALETRQRRFMAEINVIPLVDVVLVLLVIFMVTAPMLYRGIDINLPKSATNTIKPETRAVLSIERDRRLFLDKDPVSPVQLEQKLRALKDQSSEVSVYLRADLKFGRIEFQLLRWFILHGQLKMVYTLYKLLEPSSHCHMILG